MNITARTKDCDVATADIELHWPIRFDENRNPLEERWVSFETGGAFVSIKEGEWRALEKRVNELFAKRFRSY